MDEYPQKIDWSCPPVRALGSSFCPTEWPSGECGHVFWVHSAVQQNKVRATGGGGGGARAASVLPKKSTKFASHLRTLLPSVYFSLTQISLFLMGTVILSEGKQFCCQIPLIWPEHRFVFLSARKGLPCASGVGCITEEIRATLVGKPGIF